jgi:hypothetical protein
LVFGTTTKGVDVNDGYAIGLDGMFFTPCPKVGSNTAPPLLSFTNNNPFIVTMKRKITQASINFALLILQGQGT